MYFKSQNSVYLVCFIKIELVESFETLCVCKSCTNIQNQIWVLLKQGKVAVLHLLQTER